MKTILYSPKDSETYTTLYKKLADTLGRENVVREANTFDLNYRLGYPEFISAALVLLLETTEDLIELLLIREDLINHFTLIVLPELEESLFSKALLLRPRYVSNTQSDFSEIALILKKKLQVLEKSGNVKYHVDFDS